MTPRPKISVVIPVYNGLPFIQKAIESVLAQEECPAHEVIVINDGSTDGTQGVLDEFTGRIISKTIPNSGCANARNTGIRMAGGDYIALLDGDDFWFKNRLKVNAEYIRRYPEVGFFGCNFAARYGAFANHVRRHYTVLTRLRKFNFNTPLKANPFREFLYQNFIGTPSAVLAKKSLMLEAGLFDPECRLVEDLEFFFRAAMRADFLLIDEILFYKRNHESNMSADKIKLYLGHKKVLVGAIGSHQAYIRAKGLAGDCASALADIDVRIGGLYFEAGQKGTAFRFYAEALRDGGLFGGTPAFLKAVTKKTVRLLTFDAMSRKNLERFCAKRSGS